MFLTLIFLYSLTLLFFYKDFLFFYKDLLFIPVLTCGKIVIIGYMPRPVEFYSIVYLFLLLDAASSLECL